MLISGSEVVQAIASGLSVHQITATYSSSEVVSGINTVEETLTRGATSLIQKDDTVHSVWNFTTAAGGVANPEQFNENSFPNSVELDDGLYEMLYSTDLENDLTFT